MSPPSSTRTPSSAPSGGARTTRPGPSPGSWGRWTWGSTLLMTADVRPTTSCTPMWDLQGRTPARETQVIVRNIQNDRSLRSLLLQEVPSSLRRLTAASDLLGFSLEEVSTVPCLETPATTGGTRLGGGWGWDPSRSGSRASYSLKQNLVSRIVYLPWQ